MTIVHVVSHTHWDREWYESAARFRQRLVALVDELLDEPPSGGASFLLDGQAVVLEDYLAVRPQRASDVASLLQSGALEAGPWFVLSDELIPSGEALVRNLLAGRRTLRALRATPPPVLYCPDSFGHPAALPALARGFGMEVIVLWRGYGGARWPAGDSCVWYAPNGERALLYHLPRSGYELGANLPADDGAARARWDSIREALGQRNVLGTTLLLNGADHHARQVRLGEGVAALARAALPDEVRASSLTMFVTDALARATARPGTLSEIRGELRDAYGYTWTLQGTLATRAGQKRRNAHVERLLVRDAEPWAALAARGGLATTSRRQLIDAAWHSLLLCHPHDTLCGCSSDEVARAMDTRLDEAYAQGVGLRTDAVADLIGHRPELAREARADWHPVVVVRNRAARPRGGVALLKLTTFLADVPVGPGSVPMPTHSPGRIAQALDGMAAIQVLSRAVEHERTESPRHYPDDDLVSASDVAAWVDDVPAYGVRCFDQSKGHRRGLIPNQAHVETDGLSNGRLVVRVQDGGRVELRSVESGRAVENLLTWESLVDAGDLYTPSPRGAKFVPTFDGWRAIHRGPVRAGLEMRWTFRAGRERLHARVRLIVDANAPWLRLEVEGQNAAMDHRLRLRVHTDVQNPVVVADAMFGTVERVPLEVPPEEARIEQPPPTAPLHRYVSLFGANRGATIFSDGLAEYEATDEGGVLVTLVRAVGELSRADLPERPGHAGWPEATPGAQCIGPFATELALLLHGPRSAAVVDEVERAADDILLPLCGATLRSALRQPEPVPGVELVGEGLAFSAAKESEDGEWLVLRCVNLLDTECAGAWTVGSAAREARLARLDETGLEALVVDGGTVGFVAPARAIVTILVR
jgi:alpha-mannosidase